MNSMTAVASPPSIPTFTIANQLLGLVGWITLCTLAMIIGGWATSSSVTTWYPTLVKPSFNPPSYLFGIVWPILYLLMALAAWICWRDGGFARHAWPLGIFLAQLFVNALWSYLFFGLRSPIAGLAGILLLDLLVVATILSFWHVRSLAAAILLPYLAWILFATAVNAAIWYLN
jgi:tryptophan-rich sensory protein